MRLFVALDLPGHVRSALAEWAARAAPPEARRLPAEDLHVTLAFLGTRTSDEAAAAGALLPALARPLEELRTAGALWLPPRRPRVLSVALESGAALASLQAELVAALVSAIGFAPERRRFRPHVTVARVARVTRIDSRAELDPPAPAFGFHAPALTLYRSRTSAERAHYERLSGVALP